MDKRYFFLLGVHRSGTNWMSNLLNLHPDINCHGEYHFERLYNGVSEFTANPHGIGAKSPVREMAEAWFCNFVREAMQTQVERKPSAVWLGDRTPRRIEPLLLPDTPHIYVYRDGRDVTVSRVHQLLGIGGPPNEPYKTDVQPLVQAFREDPQLFKRTPERLCEHPGWIRLLARQWKNHVRQDLETIRKMEAGEVSGRVLVTRYETVHADPETERAKMYRFLELDPAAAAPLSAETKTLPGLKEERPTELYRKGATGDWANYATETFRTILKEEMGELLIELGYADDMNW